MSKTETTLARPRLLDLFCGAGGCAVGYHRAGFALTGVDLAPQPRYPFEAIRMDALEYLRIYGHQFDAIHASPPCQRYSQATFCRGNRDKHPDLIGPTRELLRLIGRPYVIENVERSPMQGAVMLCGLMFGLKVLRHRLFEASFMLLAPAHIPHRNIRIGTNGYVCVAGHGGATVWMGRERDQANHSQGPSHEGSMGARHGHRLDDPR